MVVGPVLRHPKPKSQLESEMSDQILDRYLAVSTDLEGWFHPVAQYLWHFLLDYQEASQIIGNTMEIGVYRGKSAALMALHTQENEKAVFCDKFFNPETKDMLSSLMKGAPTFLEKTSYSITPTSDLKDLQHSFRFIHIDGGHAGGESYADLKLADELLSEDGIICLDDFFSPDYPQITEMVFHYLFTHKHSLTLFLCGFRKAFLARPHTARQYMMHIYENLHPFLEGKPMERPVTLFKTTPPNDMNCLGIDFDYSGNGPFRGPDTFKASNSPGDGIIF